MAVVVIPAKPLERAKARLAGVLATEERRALTLAMLADVCIAARESGLGVIVVASDTATGAVAHDCGVQVAEDPTPDAGLNPSLEAAVLPREDGMLVLASDLPACTGEDVVSMIGSRGVIVATDASGTGTNALWRMPSGIIPLAFGAGSAAAHRELATARGAAFRLVSRPGLALDLDTPAHLKEAWDAPIGANTRAALSQMGFPDRAI